ncbi:hypothetical protein EJ357_24980 [Streptomyces cyaneochromogenes]|uniref:Uncharacterized protein n=1 Tax=Streptomyces cyaneochromogenes TaxID=2496836 RepID=A0A3S9MAS8_9ACTN|nr:hypothetical protein [Streptomyces cyaneochromogenes]AZQ36304.1 hypothetical protein EJ357_24980 [Streptomyces cyaneochromogenes]
MDWVAPVSTAIGAVIGVGSALLSERIRWRRDLRGRAVEARRELYASFLTSFDATFRSLEAVERGTYLPDLSRAEAAEDARAAHRLNAIRQHIRITAPDRIVDAVDALYRDIKQACDLLGAGLDRGSEEVLHVVDNINQRAEAVRLEMRRDLGFLMQP